MRTFGCDVCGNLLVAENSRCVACGTPQAFSPAVMRLVPVLDGSSSPGGDPAVGGAQPCRNRSVIGCNWLVDDPDRQTYCVSCRLTRTRPADADTAAVTAWAATEGAKRRLVYQLLDLGLPVRPQSDPGGDDLGLAFDLLSSREQPVLTGHADGVVTIDLAEGEDAHREAMRVQMGEPYRTMLGHLRHEVGHYYWQLLVLPDAGTLSRFRELSGDERADYAQALERHYAAGPPQDWGQRHVSAYAAAHPWEDWAETFAHYLHIRATLQSAASFGVVVAGPDVPGVMSADLVALPLDTDDESMASLVATWLPLSYALNAVNRSMGKPDLYPFVLTPPVIDKLALVHDVVRTAGAGPASSAGQFPGGNLERL